MELNALSVKEVKKLLKEKKLTSLDLVQACLSRIADLDQTIHAFLTVVPDKALRAARNADQVMQNDSGVLNTKPLLGIPVAIKDNFCTQGMRTTASSKILDNFVPPYDATVVRKLKEAGAIILGKTNMDAFAHGSSTETSDYGPTSNPWNRDFLPGGSSGGSAASVSADETIFAVGSETAGSIRGPASWCGIVGLKPTYGRISRYGLIAMASSTDSPGPLTKTVADARLVYEVLAGFDPLDATTVEVQSTKYQVRSSLKGLRIGLPKEYFRSEAQKGVNEAVLEAVKLLEKQGARIKEVSLFDPRYAISVYTILQRSEVSSNLARFTGLRFGQDRSFFNEENTRRIMLGTYTLSSGYYDAYYKKAQQVRTIIVKDFEKVFASVDLLVSPALPTTALPKGATRNQSMFGELADILTEPSSIAGLPGISVPCGFSNGLPVGLQIIGPQWSEDLILDVAEEYEGNTDWHKRKPKII